MDQGSFWNRNPLWLASGHGALLGQKPRNQKGWRYFQDPGPLNPLGIACGWLLPVGGSGDKGTLKEGEWRGVWQSRLGKAVVIMRVIAMPTDCGGM